MSVDETLKDLIITAMGAEKYSLEFYLKAAQIARNDRARRMFENLAVDELHHFIIIIDRFSRRMLAEISKSLGKKGVDFVENTPRASTLARKARNELDVLKLGLEREKMAIQFYQNGMAKVDDTGLKEVFTELLEFEQGHLKILDAEFCHLSGVPHEAEVHTYVRE
ncbi:MAG: ferritin family protein [Thermodesulfobacteriota bacterium]